MNHKGILTECPTWKIGPNRFMLQKQCSGYDEPFGLFNPGQFMELQVNASLHFQTCIDRNIFTETNLHQLVLGDHINDEKLVFTCMKI